jgi:predicted HTH transcriptional regulator
MYYETKKENNIINNINKMVNMNIHKKLLDFIKEKKVVTSSEVAKYLDLSWNTADKYLLEMVIEGKVERIKKEGVNLWMIK